MNCNYELNLDEVLVYLTNEKLFYNETTIHWLNPIELQEYILEDLTETLIEGKKDLLMNLVKLGIDFLHSKQFYLTVRTHFDEKKEYATNPNDKNYSYYLELEDYLSDYNNYEWNIETDINDLIDEVSLHTTLSKVFTVNNSDYLVRFTITITTH